MYHDSTKRRPYRSMNRRVTACAECYRRKQKCNRENPCNVCAERGVHSRCIYQRIASDTQIPRKQFTTSETTEGSSGDGIASELSFQIGYSSNDTHRGISYVLDEFSSDGPAFHARPAGHSMPPQRISPREWKKLNQLVAKLPSPAITQELLHVFFGEANWYFTVLDQFYFDQAHCTWSRSWDSNPVAVEQQVSAESLYFPALLFQVLAVGVQFVAPKSAVEKAARSMNTPSLEELSQHFSETGERILNMLGRHIHAITAIQADMMRCAWLKNCGRGAEAWYSLGNAVRQAQDQRLHLEPKSKPIVDSAERLREAWCQEHRRRLWACLFTWESHMALQLGRPRLINAHDCTVNSPIDSDIPENPSRTLFAPAALDERPSHYTSQNVKHYLAQQIHRLMSLGALSPEFRDYTTIQSMNAEVIQLLNDLPPVVRPEMPDTSWDLQCPELVKHRLQISIIASSFLLSLHRPHAARHPQSLELAISAAIQVLDASQLLFGRTEQHQYKTYTLIFYTIDAGMLLSAMIAKFPHECDRIAEHAVTTLRQALIRLSILKTRNPAAISGEKVLTWCLEKLGHVLQKLQPESESNPCESERHIIEECSQGEPQKLPFEPQNAHYEDPAQRPCSEVTTIDSPRYMRQIQSARAIDQEVTDDQDLFTEIMNDSAYTASWLEQMNSMSSTDFDFQEDCFDWSAVFQ